MASALRGFRELNGFTEEKGEKEKGRA